MNRPTTIKEAEKMGYEWMARYPSWCEFCSKHDYDTKSIATYAKKVIGGENLSTLCEECGKAQGL